MNYTSIVEVLRHRAEQDAERRALIFLLPDGTVQTITHAQLHQDAMRKAAQLREHGIHAGDLLLLVLGHSYELVATLFGAIYAGAVPSIFPYFAPGVSLEAYVQRVERLVLAAGVKAAIPASQFEADIRAMLAPHGCRVLTLNGDAPAMPFQLETPVGNEHPAYIQWSSGTTGLPKGVALSHPAILNQMAAIAQALQFTREEVSVGWLPLFHDMGLFTQVFLPLFVGSVSVLMEPAYWVRQPKALLWAVHEYKGTVSWMPNFAFNHCVNNISDQELQGLDLGSWRLLGNGAELVQIESLEAFAERFAPYGFKRDALVVGYGLAENVVGAAATPLDTGLRTDWVSIHHLQAANRAVPVAPHTAGARRIVSCGCPLPAVEITVADDAGNVLPERHAGEIRLRSNALFLGYHRQPDKTAEVMRDGWFHTGDVGYLADGQVYVFERKQDLIIVGGRNIRPHDIESLAKELLGVSGAVVAFGVRDERLGTEQPVVICELRHTLDKVEQQEIARQLRRRVVQELDVVLGDVRFVSKGWIIKTTSGKIARAANRQQYEATLAPS